ncbi:MAG: DUF2480 family protein [Cyclobacteriaceae bacterium]|jgi:hypothetical protein|nr:DUF2480 family protein [Flammeovirgaceae bacterium]
MDEQPIINRVANSAIKTIDLEEFYTPGERVAIDLKDQLFQGMILREKDFREFIRLHDWSQYRGKLVAVHCSADAIIPTWAYMLMAAALQPHAAFVHAGTLTEMEVALFREKILTTDWSVYREARVVLKGCGKIPVPASAYLEATARLRPWAASIMFGEPCSTVPVYKAPKTAEKGL